ncbi:glycosyl hydrolase family 47 protein [Metarhizium acridum CQMa 102]|uniref:alpha-1,2-Mannosidase n=1 Tax=Metarhizium acridum (strain CQMa 102) TaxID=655827 RepID=E9DVU4_METAQ|nr:glycosyl hydrolase family 47 protein [Metarhizium acridum CQMa 102]EFY92141.1 glycosyl hydrolase family 47 protein [Metarhizium acridum CQMa 102]
MFVTAAQRRDIAVAVLVIFAFWQLRYVVYPEPPTHMGRLKHWMNDAAPKRRIRHVPSSFDWSRVGFSHQLTSQVSLPTPLRSPRPSAQKIQHQFAPEDPEGAEVRVARLMEVRGLFRENWKSYRELAWMQDALLPVSGGSREQFSGWAATLVDSLDTLWIMGLRDEFDEAVEAACQIDFGVSTSPRVNTFETNIRYLGGLMAAYDLSGREALLQKAVELGDLIYAAFNTPNGMPVDFIDFAAAKAGEALQPEPRVVSASPGTLSLEMTRLSQITGDAKYYGAASRVMDLFCQGQNRTELPGAWPMWVSMRDEDVVSGGAFTLGGGEDSLFEYLPKMHQLLRGGDDKYRAMAGAFLDAADRHFVFRPMTPTAEDILLPGNVNVVDGKPVLDPETEHLACFVGGMFGLAGRLLNRTDYLDSGIRLTNGCVYAYRSFPTGMMPERINTVPCDHRSHCPWQEALWDHERKKRPEWKPHLPEGFTTAKDPRYILRPEAIESVFYMYRITGDEAFQDKAWDMFTAISNGTRTEYANAAVLDVTVARYPLPKMDYMEVSLESCTDWAFQTVTQLKKRIPPSRASGWPRH